MNRRDLLRRCLIIVGLPLAMMIEVFIGQCSVRGRAPSPSPSVATATPVISEMAPARPLVDGNGEDGRPFEGLQGDPALIAAHRADPASTVTTQALVTATVVIDPVPATPVSTSSAVVTQGAESNISSLIAASPWPQYLWGTVACLVERESRGVATAVGLAGEHGLMQIHPATWGYLSKFGITPDGLFDPATNFRAGWELYLWAQRYQGDGFQPWGGGCA